MAKIYIKKVLEEVEDSCKGCCFAPEDKNCKKLNGLKTCIGTIYKLVKIEK